MRARLLTVALPLAIVLFAGAAGCGGDEDESAPNRVSSTTPALEAKEPRDRSAGVLAGSLPLLNGEPQDLSRYAGKVVLVVNTASECGFAPQFEGLEALYREKREQGLVVLGFPADDVVGQEPRSNQEIAEYCRANFGVSFPMFAKSNVVDDPVNPLFVELSDSLGEPTYNFNKYLLDRRGRPVEHFDQYTEPEDPALSSRLDALLRR
jgi:glutathione peroxidase